jgi:MerR family transcriptional regulator, mercuric resistance operon regulatory protein
MTHQNPEMRRAELAKKSGVNLETIRYYEGIGLLLEPKRSPAGHRLYAEDTLKRLTFVKRSRELGYTLDEIRNLLDLVDNRTYTCDQVRVITLERLADVKAKIRDLNKIANSLKDMATQCEGAETPACHVIDVLYG